MNDLEPIHENVKRLEPEPTPTPAQEQAIILYALGKFRTKQEAAAACGIGPTRFGVIINSPAGKAILKRVREELNFRLSSLYEKYIDAIEEGLDSPDFGIRLAAAKLYQSTEIGEKVNVQVSAEDVVRQIMQGTYTPGG